MPLYCPCSVLFMKSTTSSYISLFFPQACKSCMIVMSGIKSPCISRVTMDKEADRQMDRQPPPHSKYHHCAYMCADAYTCFVKCSINVQPLLALGEGRRSRSSFLMASIASSSLSTAPMLMTHAMQLLK